MCLRHSYLPKTIQDCLIVPVPKSGKDLTCSQNYHPIRASVDALCRDERGQISRDPRTKRLITLRESLAKPSKHASKSAFVHITANIKRRHFFEAGRPVGRVRAHTLRLRKFRAACGAHARAHINVRVHGMEYTHAVNAQVYVCAQLHN